MAQKKDTKAGNKSSQLSLFDEQSAPVIPDFFTYTAELTDALMRQKPKLTIEQRLRHARAH